MTLDEIRTRIAAAIEKRFGTSKEALLSDASFVELEFDSLIIVEVQLLLEDVFQVVLEEDGDLPGNLTELAKAVQRALELNQDERNA